MGLALDKQTLEDLNITGKYKSNSVYNIFNKVRTDGGERLLGTMFDKPLSDAPQINKRSAIFKYFQEQGLVFPLERQEVVQLEDYLVYGASSYGFANSLYWLYKKYQGAFLHDPAYAEMIQRQAAAIRVLQKLQWFVLTIPQQEEGVYADEWCELREVLSNPIVVGLLNGLHADGLGFWQRLKLDNKLRKALNGSVLLLMDRIYELDVYIAVSRVSADRGFAYAEAIHASESILAVTQLWHPSLRHGVPNTISLDSRNNLMFLTGANMAGKSTLMKSIGIGLYLAHLGFPVAAESMTFSVMDGLYTSINVSDNLHQGYSHFYAEVLRVKQAAQMVHAGNNMLVIFDELFKGTNVKDAYDATLAVSKAFAAHRNCLFIISTHIVEVGEALADQNNIQFRYLPTVMEKNIARYTYQVTAGISSDRHGMTIIRNEGILEMIKGERRDKFSSVL
jgi:DNA mismatch repair protein MutS